MTGKTGDFSCFSAVAAEDQPASTAARWLWHQSDAFLHDTSYVISYRIHRAAADPILGVGAPYA
jgi:hypothetical protein